MPFDNPSSRPRWRCWRPRPWARSAPGCDRRGLSLHRRRCAGGYRARHAPRPGGTAGEYRHRPPAVRRRTPTGRSDGPHPSARSPWRRASHRPLAETDRLVPAGTRAGLERVRALTGVP